MKYFVTGTSGFVGAHFLERLLRDDQHQVAILLRSPATAWRIAHLLDRVTVIQGELDDLEKVESQIAEFAPETIVHLAWSGVQNTFRNDTQQIDNIFSSLKLVQIAGRVGAKAWIGLGSQAEYGPCCNQIDETTPTRPSTLYGAAKLSVCVTAERLCAELGLRFGWLRLFSSYGPKDHPSWLIPSVALALLQGDRPVTTEGEQLWDYIHAEDVAEAIYQVAQTSTAAGVFNLGSGHITPIRHIIEMIRNCIDPELPIGFGELPYRPDQVMHLQADTSRLHQATGWQAAVRIDQGIPSTVDWYREQMAN